MSCCMFTTSSFTVCYLSVRTKVVSSSFFYCYTGLSVLNFVELDRLIGFCQQQCLQFNQVVAVQILRLSLLGGVQVGIKLKCPLDSSKFNIISVAVWLFASDRFNRIDRKLTFPSTNQNVRVLFEIL